MRRPLLALVAGCVGLLVNACGPADKPKSGGGGSDPPANAGGDTANLTPPQKVFNDSGCGKCHKLDGIGMGRMDISKAGSKHDKTWIAAHIRNAKEHSPMSQMPPYTEDKLNAKDLDTLSDYLAGKK